MSAQRLTLIGDGIENPGNARAMLDAAAMFGAACVFRDPAARLTRAEDALDAPAPLLVVDRDTIEQFSPLVVLDNVPGAASVYGWRLPPGPQPALAAGNERRGVSPSLCARAAGALEIPLASRRLNTLNVAAASAVALYYLSRDGGGRQRISSHPASRRPDVLLCGPTDHVELGSAIRSAGAFGWQRLLIDDRHHVWFGVERAKTAEGRAAARRRRNPIRLIPTTPADRLAYRHVTVISTAGRGTPPHRANLARGHAQLVVIADQQAPDADHVEWERLGSHIEVAGLALAGEPHHYRYRLIASIVLAEIARQVGRTAPSIRPPRPRPVPFYDRTLAVLAEERGEIVSLDELQEY